MTIRFTHDEFAWDAARDTYLLPEPPLLFGEPPPRHRVHAWRAEHGWQLLYSREFDAGDDRILIDFWSQITGPNS